MRVEELIIDGFKSYATRTHITNWDAEFNAITGLNGSGKSNILDSICFVLGIKNMKLLRANNLQDLIYKRGQAGITKASVTIIFNNEDRARSPLGYEDCQQISLTRQIMVGGKNKYLINGHNAQEQAVFNMLQSVQLNVNNPHFLIMQGKITQVLNMQPPEILAMIEEAAGTRMFEERKDKALKTIGKKERKIDDITTILNDEITPKLDKLRKEKSAFLEFKKVEIELDRLRRLAVAYDYTKNEERLTQGNSLLETAIESEKALTLRIDELKAEMAQVAESKSQIEAKKAQEMRKDGSFRTLESKVNSLSKDLVKIKTQLDLKAATIQEEESKKKSLKTSMSQMESQMVEKRKRCEAAASKLEEYKKSHDEKNKQIQQLEELIQSLTTGVASDEGREGGFIQQLQEARGEANASSTSIEQAKLKTQLLVKERKELKIKSEKAKGDNSALLKNKKDIEGRINSYEAKLSKHKFDPEAKSSLETKRSEHKEGLESLFEKQQELQSRLRGLDFKYTSPTPNFDHSKVKGMVAQLITLESRNKFASTALEMCAGGQLYNVVVKDDNTGALLLEKGKLRQRCTILPLNRLSVRQANPDVVNFAKSLAPGKVDLALSLISYDKEVEPAMVSIFGNTLVCKDPATAQKVAFHKSVQLKCVTLEGDIYDPAGTLQGGSRPQSGGILDRIQSLNQIKESIKLVQGQISGIEQQIDAMTQVSNEYNASLQELDLAKHELELIQRQLESSSHAQMLKRLEAIESEIESQKAINKESSEKLKVSKQRISDIEKEMEEFHSDKGGKLKELEVRLKNLRKEFPKIQASLKKCQKQAQDASLESENFEGELKEMQDQIDTIDQSLEEVSSEQVSINKQLEETKNELDESQAQLTKAGKQIRLYDREYNELEESFKEMQAEMRDGQLELQQKRHDIEQHSESQKQAKSLLQKLIKEHAWIEDESHLFGQPNSPYDFVKQDPVQAKKKFHRLNEKFSQMRKSTNTAVMTNLESVEKREEALTQMLKTVKRDKKKIEKTIDSLDQYKTDALENTWHIVNEDFGKIFGDLLNGNTAKLEQLEGQPLTAGLQIKVNLGGVWKQSLTELSGGQRSLIALSLILSLLQFKPAPMYILDEIDAALDLSHTQNIGQLFRNRFKNSQFIVVSLKEGMFNNANVLFRAKFRNGISVVESVVQRQPRRK